ncbi:unnamed protein product [Ophioblennius macclurei]
MRMRGQRQHAQLAASGGSAHSASTLAPGAMSPISSASFTVAALLLLSAPPCRGAPVDLQQTATHQPLSQIEAACSSYLTADLQFWASDVLQELCGMILLHKSKTSELHPLLNLASQLHPRRERGLSMDAELQGPGGIQSRGFFLYRPRNGRRFLEYE